MRKLQYLLFAAILVLTACNSNSRKGKTLTVTIEPQRFFLEKLVGDAYHINVLVPPGTSPEAYDPVPLAMTNLSKSEMYFKVGNLGYEVAWARDLARNNPDVKIVDCSKGMKMIFGEEHEHDEEVGGHSHVAMADPHVWSSPKTAKQFVKNMYRALLFSEKDGVALYKKNHETLEKLIDDTDKKVEEILANVPSRSFIIYHPALSYFAQDYNLKQYSIEDQGKSPSPAQMKELTDLARHENIKVIFVQKEFDTKNAEILAKEIGAKIYTINPLAYEWDKETIRIADILAGKAE